MIKSSHKIPSFHGAVRASRYGRVRLILAFIAALATPLAAQNTAPDKTASRILPYWAYPVFPPGVVAPPVAPDDGSRKHLPGSSAAFTTTEVADRFSIADWFPESHPPMSEVISHGRKAAAVQGCGYCHLPNGQGHPQNASLAGLSIAYFQEQIADFKKGLRKSSEARFGPETQMIQIATGLTGDETKAAAEYFGSMKYRPWIRVLETATVPKTTTNGSMLLPAPRGGKERIGNRVIELPEHPERTELRDPTSSFVAYVPAGSVKKGELLATTGDNGKTIPCMTCHGPGLKGVGAIPSLAGRSPSQMARQIVDFQTGARNGAGAQLMKPVVSKLDDADIVAITAYLASLKP
jgi:cytochrome c553